MMINSKSKCDMIMDEVLTRIRTKKYVPEQKLPSESVLAQEFGVSRVTIRESIKKLSMMNVLTVKQGKGTFVNEISVDSYMKPVLSMIKFDDMTITEIMDARECIELTTVAFAARNCTKKQAESLRSRLRAMKQALDNGNFGEYAEIDTDFHVYIAKIAGNSILLRTYHTIVEILTAYLTEMHGSGGFMDTSYDYHCRIAEAIEKHDADLAKELMTEHLDDGRRYYNSVVPKRRSKVGL